MKIKFVITAGPTREHLDPVRFLSNPSTGKMGFAIAAEAARRGYETVLVAGPVALKTPKGVRRIDVVSAREMLSAVEDSLPLPGKSPRSPRNANPANRANPCECVLISTAAVADWRPAKCAAKKLKKDQMSGTLKLVRNPDILKTIHRRFVLSTPPQKLPTLPTSQLPNSPTPTQTPKHPNTQTPPLLRLVGFAAETNDVLAEAARKCRAKGLSFIVANDVTRKGSGFGTDTNEVTFVFPDGTLRRFPLMTKRMVAKRIIDAAEAL